MREKAHLVGAERWLEGLADLVAYVEQTWSISVGRAYQDATEAFVAEATQNDGTPAVLKLLMPRDDLDARGEAIVLTLTGGEGCVALLREDDASGALLLERLGPTLHSLGLPIEARHEILCRTVERVWRPASGCGLPSGAVKAGWLSEFIMTTWESLDRPCTLAAVDYALTCAESRRRAHDDERAVLVHGDVHEWNALQSGDDFKLVDPDGLLAEAEYDLGVLMREDPVELQSGDPFDRACWLAARCGLDATAIWEWGVVERVSTGLLGTQVGLEPIASQMLQVADRIAT